MPGKSRFVAAAFAVALSFSASAAGASTAPQKTLHAFASEAELKALFKGWAEQMRRAERRALSAPGLPQSAPEAQKIVETRRADFAPRPGLGFAPPGV